MFDLSGKTALVTGASGGIGQAIALVLYNAGAEVALTGTREAVLNEVVTSLGERAHPIVADLSDKEAPAGIVKAAGEAMDGIDILVNNAGVTRDNLFMRMSDEEWDDVINVNLAASFRLCRGALRGMMRKRWGRIINMSSVVGITGNPGQGNYAASKAGMIGMTKALAQEVASRGVTANAIAPGFIETPMTDDLDDAQKEALFGRIPAGRMGTPEDIAAGVLYLASEEAAYVTGSTLHINGGLAML